jgi:hypothetical protein
MGMERPIVPAQNSFTAEIIASRSAQVSELSVLQAAPPIPSIVSSISKDWKSSIPKMVSNLLFDDVASIPSQHPMFLASDQNI